ncbi:hypothetical protein GGQ68_000989 [Sagittula marina]|uniref:Glycosyltransferase 2-like domain-containing protein n=1 Tax=Sagittula marina TaxID=943940 RepID=A0A7W6DRF2_9RHOB|nr:TIGR04283 family arsenosugar biosynthesis glycosyltransferase [Sagittula marina]MBB3984673.1 hypothetical protein [Sagittula marina]
MRAPISVVIPTLNAQACLPRCLMALGEGLNAGLIRELVVSDGGSTDATVRVAEAAGAEVVSGPASRGGQLRRGCDAAQGDWLLVLHADTVLLAGWSEAVVRKLSADNANLQADSAGYFLLSFEGGGAPARLVAAWANLRSRVFGLPYGDQGLLISRALYDAVGGYPDIPLMEDVALARALKGRLDPVEGVAETSAEKYRRQGWLRRGGRNLMTLVRYLSGADPEALARSYRR